METEQFTPAVEQSTPSPVPTLPVKKERQSGIELLKIIGIILVVISHVVQTLGTNSIKVLGFNDYYINLNQVTADFVRLIVIILRYSGQLGNTIFFVCSAWFLTNSKQTNGRKLWRMVCDVFTISILWLIPMVIIKGANVIGKDLIVQSVFPTFFENNWYVTAYIMFCFIYPFLNQIIEKADQKKHFIIAFSLFFCYSCLAFFYQFPAYCTIILWVSIYFFISYFKKYAPIFCSSVKINAILLAISLVCQIGLIVLTNYRGLHDPAWKSAMLHWNKNCSPFSIMTAFTCVNLFGKCRFRSKFVNYVSGLSLLIYIIHENILFRIYLRPLVWHWIYINLGYDLLLLWILLYVVLLFIASALVAALYKISLQKVVGKGADLTYNLLGKLIKFLQEKIMRILK